MTIRAEVEGIGVLEFPDGTSPAVIQSTVKREVAKRNNPVGAGEDIAKTAIPSAIRGAASLVGAPGDLWGMISGGAANAVGYLGEKFGLADPGFRERLSAVAKPELPLPTSSGLLGMVEDRAWPLYRPQTTPGRLAGGLIEGAASAPFGRAMAGMGAISGGAAETAGLLTEGTGAEPYARFAASVAAPSFIQMGKNWKDIPGKMLREATGDMTPQQFAEAQQRIELARKYGIDLTAPEAMPPSSIQQLMSDVAASKSGGRVVNDFMAKRPGQVKTAVRENLLKPTGADRTPDVNMATAKNAATEVIENAEKARTAKASPFYQAAELQGVPDDAIKAVIARIDADIAKTSDPRVIRELTNYKNGLIKEVKTVEKPAGLIVDERGSPMIPGEPATKVTIPETRMSSLVKTEQLNRYSNDLPAIGASGEERVKAAITRPYDAMLADALKSNNENFKKGAETYRKFSEDVINPLTAGPVGRVAGKQGFDPSVPQNLNPVSAISNEAIARPEGIRELYTQMFAVNREAFPGIARTWLENAFDTATQRVQAGENRMMGANFAKAVYGTDQQIANFAETMRGVAISNGVKKPDDFVKGARNLMEVLQMTGKVPGIGSPTGGRIASNEMARGSMAAGALETISTSPGRPLAGKLRDWAMQGNYKKLAEVLTDPESIKKIEALGKYRPDTTTAQALAIGLLNAGAQ